MRKNTFVKFQDASTFLHEVRKRNKQTQARTSYAFDSIWAAALMLNSTSNETRPEDLELGSDKFSTVYEELLRKQEFEGISVSEFICSSSNIYDGSTLNLNKAIKTVKI